jgi:hypothetical protein
MNRAAISPALQFGLIQAGKALKKHPLSDWK